MPPAPITIAEPVSVPKPAQRAATLSRPTSSAPYTATQSPRISFNGLLAVLVLHAAVFWMLLRMNVISMPDPLTLLSIRMISPQVVTQQEPEPTKPEIRKPSKPEPVPNPQPVRVAAPADSLAPATSTVVPPPPATPTNSVSPAPTAIATPTPPRFDADYLDNPAPRYPPVARSRREQGSVMLRVNVDATGAPTEVLLHASSGVDSLDQAALSTVRRWRFVPAKFGNTAIAAWVLVPINFHLKD